MNYLLRTLCFISLGFMSITQIYAHNRDRFPIIPMPLRISPAKGDFKINIQTTLVYPLEIQESVGLLNKVIKFKIGRVIKDYSAKRKKNNAIFFKKDDKALKPESYVMTISPEQIIVTYADNNGAFYAIQSLIQLIMGNVAQQESIQLPAAIIEDSPAFGYRGLMLDLARYYMPVDVIKKYVRLMASYKMNNLHLHLTDDQGWRIEIIKYPMLQEVGSWRKESIVGHKNDTPRVYDGIRHGGFYTQNELKDLVIFAEKHFVTIIPEIEMPGHASAALAAYPELGCQQKNYEVSRDWGIHKEVFCPNEFTFQFLQDVLSEVITIFPGRKVHIGGDECPKNSWKACRKCQDLLATQGMENVDDLQNYFMKRISEFLISKGKQAVSWDWEGAHDSSEQNETIIMSWQGEGAGINAAKRGEFTIMTPHLFTYLDYYQTNERNVNEPLSIAGYLPIEMTYSYQPIPTALNETEAQFVLGVQACLWSEYIPSEEISDYKLFPRLIALAEVAWSAKENRDYSSFLQRLMINKKILDKEKVNYYKPN